MPTYRTKPNKKEAWIFNELFYNDAPKEFLAAVEHDGNKYIIQTLEGPHEVSYGDYIIKGLHGEFYPCKPDIFEKSYELVD